MCTLKKLVRFRRARQGGPTLGFLYDLPQVKPEMYILNEDVMSTAGRVPMSILIPIVPNWRGLKE